MKRWMIVLVLLAPLVSVSASSNPYERVVQQSFASGGTVRLHLEAGGYTIKAASSDNIVVTYSANSDDLSRVKVDIKPMASRVDIYVRNTPRNNFNATIEVPRNSNLWARLSAGELSIEDVEGDKDLELWAGQINVDVPHPDAYGHRDASVLAGSLEAGAFNISKGGLFRSFRQEGAGKYRFHAHVTTGEIDVR
jgi:hypothetical protein